MNPQHQQAIEYVRTHLGHGYTHQQLADHMRAHGWTDEQIDWAFYHTTTVPQEAAAASQNPPVDNATAGGHQPNLQKYGVFRAIADTCRAIVRNPLGVLTSIGVAVCMIAVVGLLSGFVLTLVGHSNIRLSLTSIVTVLVFMAIAAGAIVVLIYAVMIGALTRSLVDGVNGRKSNIPALAKASFRQAPRLTWVGLQLYARMVWPLVAVLLLLLVSPSLSGAGALLSILAMVAGIVWLIIAWLRYALAMSVAVLEPELPASRCFARSFALLKGRGQWFVLKALVLLIAIYILLARATGQNIEQLGDSNNPLILIAEIVINLFFMGAIVMLYRNRAALHGHSSAAVQ